VLVNLVKPGAASTNGPKFDLRTPSCRAKILTLDGLKIATGKLTLGFPYAQDQFEPDFEFQPPHPLDTTSRSEVLADFGTHRVRLRNWAVRPCLHDVLAPQPHMFHFEWDYHVAHSNMRREKLDGKKIAVCESGIWSDEALQLSAGAPRTSDGKYILLLVHRRLVEEDSKSPGFIEQWKEPLDQTTVDKIEVAPLGSVAHLLGGTFSLFRDEK
jgi:hypothetical protein